MGWVKRWLIVMAIGGTLLVGPTGSVVAAMAPGYVASPPVVGTHSYRHFRPYRYRRPYRPHWHSHPYRYYRPYPRAWRYHYDPYRYYGPYGPYYGWPPYGPRW
jgi:hypothetical protein